MGEPLDLIESFGRTQAIRGNIAGFAFDLLLDPGDADLEKFVEVGTENVKELYPLDQRLGRVLCFFENAPIEFEPTQLAINEILRIPKTLMSCLRNRNRLDCDAFFRFNPGLRLRHIIKIDNQPRITSARRYVAAAAVWCRMSSAAAA